MQNLDNVTHKVIVTIGSVDDGDGVGVEIKLDPEMTGGDYHTLGYQPASHQFLEQFILPMLEHLYLHDNFPELFDEDGGLKDVTVN